MIVPGAKHFIKLVTMTQARQGLAKGGHRVVNITEEHVEGCLKGLQEHLNFPKRLHRFVYRNKD